MNSTGPATPARSRVGEHWSYSWMNAKDPGSQKGPPRWVERINSSRGQKVDLETLQAVQEYTWGPLSGHKVLIYQGGRENYFQNSTKDPGSWAPFLAATWLQERKCNTTAPIMSSGNTWASTSPENSKTRQQLLQLHTCCQGHNKHIQLDIMGWQRNGYQTKAQDENTQKQLNEEEIGILPKK